MMHVMPVRNFAIVELPDVSVQKELAPRAHKINPVRPARGGRVPIIRAAVKDYAFGNYRWVFFPRHV